MEHRSETETGLPAIERRVTEPGARIGASAALLPLGPTRRGEFPRLSVVIGYAIAQSECRTGRQRLEAAGSDELPTSLSPGCAARLVVEHAEILKRRSFIGARSR